MTSHGTTRVVGAALLAMLFFSGCGSGDDAAISAPLMQEPGCVPFQPRPCPCLPMGAGTQTCLESGDGYGPCIGCPPPPPPPEPPVAQMTPEPAEVELVVDASMSDEGALDAGMLSDDMVVADGGAGLGDASLEALPIEVGASCGVGLPAVCELATEKCCVRSLETDTCIPAAESCDCDLRGCSTLEAHCDGPEDCDDGQVCCGTLQGSTYSEFSCESNCDYRGTQRIACHQSEPACPNDTVCSNSQLLTNLQVCIDPATIEQ